MTEPAKKDPFNHREVTEQERLFLGFIPPAIGRVIGSIFVTLFLLVGAVGLIARAVNSFNNWNWNKAPHANLVHSSIPMPRQGDDTRPN